MNCVHSFIFFHSFIRSFFHSFILKTCATMGAMS